MKKIILLISIVLVSNFALGQKYTTKEYPVKGLTSGKMKCFKHDTAPKDSVIIGLSFTRLNKIPCFNKVNLSLGNAMFVIPSYGDVGTCNVELVNFISEDSYSHLYRLEFCCSRKDVEKITASEWKGSKIDLPDGEECKLRMNPASFSDALKRCCADIDSNNLFASESEKARLKDSIESEKARVRDSIQRVRMDEEREYKKQRARYEDSVRIVRTNEEIAYAKTMQESTKALPRYKIVQTENIHISLKLDTKNGLVYMVQYKMNDTPAMDMAINWRPITNHGWNGRFDIYPTKNIYNFLMVDNYDGTVYQVQWNTGTNYFVKKLIDM